MPKTKPQFTRKNLQRAMDSGSWERGISYFRDGRDESLIVGNPCSPQGGVDHH